MTVRILLQDLWLQELGWDSILNESTSKSFKRFFTQTPILKQIRIPRWSGNIAGSTIELIGFSDASGKGYAAVIYSRVLTEDGLIVQLIAARGRVTPLKTKEVLESKTITILKLELESILLLPQLYKEVKSGFGGLRIHFSAYTDSKVALAWVRNTKQNENALVNRRVKLIREILEPSQIHYVKSEDNPADAASRGLDPKGIVNCNLWFKGPTWLYEKELPITPLENSIPSINTNLALIDSSLIQMFSDFRRLLRTTTWCLRWRNHNRGPLLAEELESTKLKLLKNHQDRMFQVEWKMIEQGKTFPRGHWFRSLAPYIGQDGLIRVGGRLENSNLPLNIKHPIIMEARDHLTTLIVRDSHHHYYHAGPRLMENLLRKDYWINKLKYHIRKVNRECIICQRFNAKGNYQMMADLPKERLSPTPIFYNCGVDLCGPFLIKSSKLRKSPPIKNWVVVYVF